MSKFKVGDKVVFVNDKSLGVSGLCNVRLAVITRAKEATGKGYWRDQNNTVNYDTRVIVKVLDIKNPDVHICGKGNDTVYQPQNIGVGTEFVAAVQNLALVQETVFAPVINGFNLPIINKSSLFRLM
jgi:hypothetical protein